MNHDLAPISPTDWRITFDGDTSVTFSVDRKLELPVSITLLDQERACGLGGRLV